MDGRNTFFCFAICFLVSESFRMTFLLFQLVHPKALFYTFYRLEYATVSFVQLNADKNFCR